MTPDTGRCPARRKSTSRDGTWVSKHVRRGEARSRDGKSPCKADLPEAETGGGTVPCGCGRGTGWHGGLVGGSDAECVRGQDSMGAAYGDDVVVANAQATMPSSTAYIPGRDEFTSTQRAVRVCLVILFIPLQTSDGKCFIVHTTPIPSPTPTTTQGDAVPFRTSLHHLV
jgi:hypothetical protein